jgi:ADP-ribosyl-[dinitrogen reductase] hydrolase
MSGADDATWDRCRGCVLGLFVGDAAGATLEFQGGRLTAAKVRRAMGMPGGGAHNVGPGQVTDDSELAIHLLRALAAADAAAGFPADAVAAGYVAWHRSEPFDMGHTCARAFGFVKAAAAAGAAADMSANARRYNMMSQANGALMRVAPLAVWARGLPAAAVAEMARQDARLSHPNAVCQDCNAKYCVAIAWLLNHPRDAAGAVKAAEAVEAVEPTADAWLAESASKALNAIECKENEGHVRHAFTLAFYFLRRATPFEAALEATLAKGGDTDTNAAIVDAMLGALHGRTAIPEAMSGPVLAFDCDAVEGKNLLGRHRPALYSPRRAMAVLDGCCCGFQEAPMLQHV